MELGRLSIRKDHKRQAVWLGNGPLMVDIGFFRADKCFAFVAEKPWRSGVAKYGK